MKPIHEQIEDVLRTIYDPELPVNIYDLGLIYDVEVKADKVVFITMTLTAPSCPAAQTLPVEVENKVRDLEEVKDVHVQITWEPKWDKSMMSEVAQLELGFM